MKIYTCLSIFLLNFSDLKAFYDGFLEDLFRKDLDNYVRSPLNSQKGLFSTDIPSTDHNILTFLKINLELLLNFMITLKHNQSSILLIIGNDIEKMLLDRSLLYLSFARPFLFMFSIFLGL